MAIFQPKMQARFQYIRNISLPPTLLSITAQCWRAGGLVFLVWNEIASTYVYVV